MLTPPADGWQRHAESHNSHQPEEAKRGHRRVDLLQERRRTSRADESSRKCLHAAAAERESRVSDISQYSCQHAPERGRPGPWEPRHDRVLRRRRGRGRGSGRSICEGEPQEKAQVVKGPEPPAPWPPSRPRALYAPRHQHPARYTARDGNTVVATATDCTIYRVATPGLRGGTLVPRGWARDLLAAGIPYCRKYPR